MCVFTHTHPESIQMLSCLHPFLTQGVKTSQAADLLAARMSAFLFLVFLGGLKGHQKHPFDLGFGAGLQPESRPRALALFTFFSPPPMRAAIWDTGSALLLELVANRSAISACSALTHLCDK